MKFDHRTYLLGEILDERLRGQTERVFTRVVPDYSAVLTLHQPGDLIAGWAMAMCLGTFLLRVQSTFPNFRYTDVMTIKGESKGFEYESPLENLIWWENLLPDVIQLELQMVDDQFTALAVDLQYGLAMVAAIEWFIKRHRCRPPGVGEELYKYELQIAEQIKASSADASIVSLPGLGIDNLPVGERRAVEAMRAMEESDFSFLEEAGFFDPEKKEARRKEREAEEDAQRKAEQAGGEFHIPPKQFNAYDDVEEEAFGFMKVARAEAPDGFRAEDRKGLDRFRRYVGLAAKQVQPLQTRWLVNNVGNYTDLGQRIFAFGQMLFSTSFPNSESAKLREEELAADRARMEREALEKAEQQRRGGTAT